VVNAVIDALDHAGLGARAEGLQMPITAERVWRALNLGQIEPFPFKA
jgi:carbon-monoxide dehydrogenase large subunit